jgi:hypothetical protein
MALTKFEKEEVQSDSKSSLRCSAMGCMSPWSVQAGGAPKCSFHQWGEWPSRAEQRDVSIEDRNMANDPKWWAKKIIRDYEAGISRSSLSVKFAKEALRLHLV